MNPYLLCFYWAAILIAMAHGLLTGDGIPLWVAIASSFFLAPSIVREADKEDCS